MTNDLASHDKAACYTDTRATSDWEKGGLHGADYGPYSLDPNTTVSSVSAVDNGISHCHQHQL